MVHKKITIIAMFVAAVLIISLAAAPAALAEEKQTKSTTPAVTLIMGATGDKVGAASVYIDDRLAGTTDSKGNLTPKEAPAAGNHTVKVAKKGLNNVTISTDFATTPVVLSMTPATGGRNLSVHVTDKNTKLGLGNVEIYNNKYKIGSTDANGYLNLTNFPSGMYLVKFSKDGYKPSTTVLVAMSNKTQNFVLIAGK